MPNFRIQNFKLERDGQVLWCPFSNRIAFPAEEGYRIDRASCGTHCPHFHVNPEQTYASLSCGQSDSIFALEKPVESSQKQPAIVSN
jgi:hypothetical protein